VSARAESRSRSARVAAQAKINLRLCMLARGTTGYHELETIFLKLALADDVVVRVTPGTRTLDVEGDVDRGALGPAEHNLAWRAATGYAERAAWPAGFAIALRKHVPIGAGLGGGSADAAAVLRALDALAPEPLGEPALLEIAQGLEEREVLLVVPPFAVNTADAYRWFSESTDWARHEQPAGVLRPETLHEWPTLASLATNDFRTVVHGRYPMLDDVEAHLRALGCDPVSLSGSGSTVFGVLPRGRRADAGALARDAAMGGSRVLLTRTASAVAPVIGAD